MMQTCTCASPDYLALHGMPETIDVLDRHLGVNYVSADTGRARNWDFMVDAEARVVQMRGSVLYVPNRHLPKKLKVFIEFLSTVYAANPVLQGDAL